MHRAALALTLALASLGLAPTANATCYAGGQACWDERATGSCATYGQGWEDVQVRAAPLGIPLHLHRHAWYTCAGGEHRTDTWHHNATAGDAADVRTTWTAHPGADWSALTLHVEGPATNHTTFWYGLRDDCRIMAYGTLLGARVHDSLACPAGPPPDVPVLPWNGLP